MIVHINADKIEIGLSISARRKRTSHKQKCEKCNELIEKGEKEIVIGGIPATYFHPKCFFCIVNILFRFQRLDYCIDCDNCKDRFECFSGEFSFLDR